MSFFMSVVSETKMSGVNTSNVRGRNLANTAINLVMAQIREATSQGSTVAWASQPGMIRTYGTEHGTASSDPRAYYKLYSAQNLVWKPVDGAFNAALDMPSNWVDLKSLFTDLNLPVQTLEGTLIYPIVDPRATAVGFSMDSSKASADNEAPMPVRWLYVLNDGTLTSPADGGEGTATWDVGDVNAPTKDNPIVGRIAFWADDDTNKVNINTAAGDEWSPSNSASYLTPQAGSYWGPPHVNTVFDRQALANYQPSQGEYQRYPGHPATTYLSAVLPTLTRDQISTIASRIQKGGSLGGTAIATDAIIVDSDRLYASVDELIYATDRSEQTGFTKDTLEQSRFFLTAHSRAPEVNLFNQPRVSMWPVHSTNNAVYRTAFDRLIAFCSRIGGNDYMFTRADATSPLSDYVNSQRNQQVYSYLQRMTTGTVPGFGGNFVDKYPQPPGANASDRDQILTQMFDYIRSSNLYDDTLKEASGTPFTPAQGTRGHGQVVPIRIGNTQGFGRFYSVSEAGLAFICTASPLVEASNHIQDETVNGVAYKKNKTLDARLTGSERRIEALFLMELFSPSRGAVTIHPNMRIKVTGLDNIRINGQSLGFPAEGVIDLNTAGASLYHGRSWGGTGGFRLPLYNGSSRRLPERGNMPPDAGLNATNVYPFISRPITVDGTDMVISGGANVVAELHYGTSGGGPSTLSEDTRIQTIRLRFQTYASLPVPEIVTVGTPNAPDSSAGTTSAPATTQENWWSFSADGAIQGFPGRLSAINRNPGSSTTVPFSGSVFRNEDVVRSLLPLHSDFRLSAGNNDVPNNTAGVSFDLHPRYKTTARLAHSFTETIGANYVQGGDTTGKLLDGASYASNVAPDVPSSDTAKTAINAATATGDWDTGVATYTDGPYINKPDEGNNARKNVDGSTGAVPYFDRNEQQAAVGATFFSPNRQISSPVMFGSLPSGLKSNTPWQTLLFRPHTGAGANHKGATSPADHLLLDLFWMPVVEPYAISEPFSTAGKINMNYELMPFTHIKRTTGLRALLRSERVIAIPKADASRYKGSGAPNTYRFDIDADETLKQFETRFSTDNDLFRSASEICSLYLVPEGRSLNGMSAFWDTNSLTGDNLKERPYSTLYPRLTTKSNTYTVHYKVQALRQASRSRGDDATMWATWDDSKDQVLSENRGSSTLERYIDPSDTTLPDFATATGSTTTTLDSHYRFRVISTKRFSP